MEQIEHDLGLWAIRFQFVAISGTHVHRAGFDLLTAFGAKSFKERTHVFPPTAAPDPEHPSRVRLDHNGGIAVSFLNGEFIDGNLFNALEVELTELVFEGRLINPLDGTLGESEVRRDLLDRENAARASHAVGEPPQAGQFTRRR